MVRGSEPWSDGCSMWTIIFFLVPCSVASVAQINFTKEYVRTLDVCCVDEIIIKRLMSICCVTAYVAWNLHLRIGCTCIYIDWRITTRCDLNWKRGCAHVVYEKIRTVGQNVYLNDIMVFYFFIYFFILRKMRLFQNLAKLDYNSRIPWW
jgi:hypothetical protein